MHPKLTSSGVLPRQHVVGKGRGISETLQGGVKEAGVSHVLKACANAVNLVPL